MSIDLITIGNYLGVILTNQDIYCGILDELHLWQLVSSILEDPFKDTPSIHTHEFRKLLYSTGFPVFLHLLNQKTDKVWNLSLDTFNKQYKIGYDYEVLGNKQTERDPKWFNINLLVRESKSFGRVGYETSMSWVVFLFVLNIGVVTC